jgi:hypothetical protein
MPWILYIIDFSYIAIHLHILFKLVSLMFQLLWIRGAISGIIATCLGVKIASKESDISNEQQSKSIMDYLNMNTSARTLPLLFPSIPAYPVPTGSYMDHCMWRWNDSVTGLLKRILP